MATLNNDKRKKRKRQKIQFAIIVIIISLFITPYLSALLDQFLSNNFDTNSLNVSYFGSFILLIGNKKQLSLFALMECGIIFYLIYTMTQSFGKIKPTETMQVADNITIPVAVGQGQHGTSRFMTKKEMREAFHTVIHNPKKQLIVDGNLGLVLGMTKEGINEVIHCISEDINSIIIGTTRSGKTRRAILETIWLRALAGKSMIFTDVKGELFIYTHKFLKSLGYDVIDFDLRETKHSKKYNYLDKIVKAIKEGDIPKAIDYTWDLVSVMVGVPKGEPLWTNGQSAVIAAGILVVAMEAPDKYKNLTNVYYFLAKMCKEDDEGKMPITKYFEKLPDTHPAKGVFEVAEISPEKMRGSFFGMALTTLRLFTNWNVADITCESEFDLSDIGKKKTALFVIVPDEKETLYPLVSLFMNQAYVTLVETANQYGGRLPYEVDMLWDEFGNFPEVPSFGSMLSAGLSRGIRFSIVIQDFQQLEKRYKDDYGNIKGNCQILVYLKTTNLNTLEEISKKTGTYTMEVNSISSSSSGKNYSNSNYSSSVNMQSRALLLPEEVGRISKPDSLVLNSGNFPAIMHAPDLSEYEANSIFGLGDEEYNKKVIMERSKERPTREPKELTLWGIWERYNNSHTEFDEEAGPRKERVSFLK